MTEQAPAPEAAQSSKRGAGYWVFAVLVALLPLLWPLVERGQHNKAEREARKRE